MSLPPAGLPCILANGDEVKVRDVHYSTNPRGTYRVSFRYQGRPMGVKAWFRGKYYQEHVPPKDGEPEEFDGPHPTDDHKPLF